jgi:hypothetical protein
MPGQGVSSVFTFGNGYGRIEMALAFTGFAIVDVTPQKWQKEFQLPKRKTFGTITQWKKHLSELAHRLHPVLEFKHDQADSVLIMEYGIRQERQNKA